MKTIKEKSLIIQPKAADVARRIPQGIRLAAELGHELSDLSEQDQEGGKPEEQVEDAAQQSTIYATNQLGSKFKRNHSRLKNPFQANRVRSNQVSHAGNSSISTIRPRHNTLHPNAKSFQTKGANFLKFQNSASNSIVKASRSIIQKVVVSIKSVVAGLKDIGTIIAAGGGRAAVALVIVLALIGWILTTPAGIIAGGRYEDNPGRSVYTVLDELSKEVDNRIDSIIEENGDGCDISILYEDSYQGILNQVGSLIITAYAVKVCMDPNDPDQVATLDARKESILREIFWQTVLIVYRIQDNISTDNNGVINVSRNLVIRIDYLTEKELIAALNLDDEQKKAFTFFELLDIDI